MKTTSTVAVEPIGKVPEAACNVARPEPSGFDENAPLARGGLCPSGYIGVIVGGSGKRPSSLVVSVQGCGPPPPVMRWKYIAGVEYVSARNSADVSAAPKFEFQ